MIEVEIRGKLTKEQFTKLQSFLSTNGKRLGHEVREMFLLFDNPGYDHNPTKREVDIRLRSTNGQCEIMVKKKISQGNVARKEVSLQLKDLDLDKAKEIVKAFGCKKAIKMNRVKDLFEYKGTEWSLVQTPKEYFYFEAEKVASSSSEASAIEKELAGLVLGLGLKVLSEKETEKYIVFLDKEVNELVDL